VIYAKAEALLQQQELAWAAPGASGSQHWSTGPAATLSEAAAPSWTGAAEDARVEATLRQWAIPVALALAWLAVRVNGLHAMMRIFLSMWLHEFSHAITAWFCGFIAIPGAWKTLVPEDRSPFFAVFVAAGLVALGVRAKRANRDWIAVVCGGGLLLQAIGTLLLRPTTAHALITFGGDAGMMILGTLLITTVYAPEGGAIRTGWLRWGFLVIGAAALADGFDTWWGARTNIDRIPFGENEGVGLSDPSKLVDQMGWTVPQLVGRYVTVGCVCLAALAVVYVIGLRAARKRLSEAV
jgi:hypothetical protein